VNKLPIHRAAQPKVSDKISRGLKQLPAVEIIRPWRGYSVGAVIRPPGVLRDVLLQQKYGRLVKAAPAEKPKPAPRKTRKPAAKKADV
jgi:hypothetical protein